MIRFYIMCDFKFCIKAYGHKNVTSRHKSTFEITTDKDLSLKGDCIIGLNMDKTMEDFPEDFKLKLQSCDTRVIVNLKTSNGFDSICGWGDDGLTLSHPSDIVCRKSTFVCDRTLMVKADKAARDLDEGLISDLANGDVLDVEIILE